MTDCFLGFKDKRHDKAYSEQTRFVNKALYRGAIKQILIFSFVEMIFQIVILFTTKSNIDYFKDFYGLIYTLIILILCLIALIIMWICNKSNGIANSSYLKRIGNEILTLLFLTGIGYIDIAFMLLVINDEAFLNLLYMLGCLKYLWKFLIGCTLLQTQFSQCIYVLETFTMLLIQYSLSNLAYRKEIIYPFVILEFIFLVVIAYHHQKIKKYIFIEKFQHVETGNTLKFILNEIPENILITDPNLVPKFVSKSLNGVDIVDLIKHIKNLKKRKDYVSSKPFSDLLTFEMSQTDDDIRNWLSRAQMYDAVYKEIEKESENQSLYDLCIGTNCSSSLYEALKTRKSTAETHMCIIFDCKLIHPELNLVKSVELKVSLASFNQEECMIFIFRDTAQRDIIARLEDNNNYKERLLASITHEVRTPLNGNLGMLESAMQDESISNKAKEKYLLPAIRSGKLLMNIFNDILDFSQINAKTLRLVFTNSNIRKTLEDCMTLIELQAEKKGLSLKLEVSKNVPEEFCTDHDRLTQIMLNLMTNAIKFTFKGHICVSANMIDDVLEISVEDTGIGIKPENIKDLFKPMTGGSSGEHFQMNCAGIGLGLWISYKLAQLLSPKQLTALFVKSTYSVGTKFAFILESKSPTIPINVTMCSNRQDVTMKNSTYFNIKNLDSEEDLLGTISEDYPIQPKDKNLSSSQGIFQRAQSPKFSLELNLHNKSGQIFQKTAFGLDSKQENQKSKGNNFQVSTSNIIEKQCSCPPILIVDDDGFNHLAIENLLQKLGYACATSFNGELGIQKIIEREKNPCCKECNPFKIIFMDCNMPVMNGFEATIKLREMMRNKEIRYSKIIACTSYTTEDKINECIKCGMDDYISKPLSIEKMKEVLKTLPD